MRVAFMVRPRVVIRKKGQDRMRSSVTITKEEEDL